MKVKKVVVELDMDDINGLIKVIGPTSIHSRETDMGMTNDEAVAVGEIFNILNYVLGGK